MGSFITIKQGEVWLIEFNPQQVKNLSNKRFIKKIGSIDEVLIKNIHHKIAKTLNPLYSLV